MRASWSVSSVSIDRDWRTNVLEAVSAGAAIGVQATLAGGGRLIGVDVTNFGQTQRNFNLSQAGQSNLLNWKWIFC